MGNQDERHTLVMDVDLFNELDRLQRDNWFVARLEYEISAAGDVRLRDLRLRPKPDLGFPPPPAHAQPETITPSLLREIARRLPAWQRQAEARVVLSTPDLSAVELELTRLRNGTTIRKRGDEYFAVDQDGNRTPYEPRDEKEWDDLARDFADTRHRRRVSRQRWSDTELQKVAAVYRDAAAQGKSAQKAICDTFYVSRSQASVLIGNARDAGHLPPSTKGRKQAV